MERAPGSESTEASAVVARRHPIAEGAAAGESEAQAPRGAGAGPEGAIVSHLKDVSYQTISEHFHLPINRAAVCMGVCVTVLKQRCREYGLARWPYRKVRKLNVLREACDDELADLRRKHADHGRAAAGNGAAGAPAAGETPKQQPESISKVLSRREDLEMRHKRLLQNPNGSYHKGARKRPQRKAAEPASHQHHRDAGEGCSAHTRVTISPTPGEANTTASAAVPSPADFAAAAALTLANAAALPLLRLEAEAGTGRNVVAGYKHAQAAAHGENPSAETKLPPPPPQFQPAVPHALPAAAQAQMAFADPAKYAQSAAAAHVQAYGPTDDSVTNMRLLSSAAAAAAIATNNTAALASAPCVFTGLFPFLPVGKPVPLRPGFGVPGLPSLGGPPAHPQPPLISTAATPMTREQQMQQLTQTILHYEAAKAMFAEAMAPMGQPSNPMTRMPTMTGTPVVPMAERAAEAS